MTIAVDMGRKATKTNKHIQTVYKQVCNGCRWLCFLFSLLSSDFLIVLQKLMQHDKCKVYDWMNEKGFTPLYQACLEQPEKTVDPLQQRHVAVEMLISGGVDPALTNKDRCPIHVAVSNSDIK